MAAMASFQVPKLITPKVPLLQNSTTKASTNFQVRSHEDSPDHEKQRLVQQKKIEGSRRRQFIANTGSTLVLTGLHFLSQLGVPEANAGEYDYAEYKADTEKMIQELRATLALDKSDPSKPQAVAKFRVDANDWVAKYRGLGKASYGDMYSVLNAVCGHYISFGPTAPIPAKRMEFILEDVTATEKALARGR